MHISIANFSQMVTYMANIAIPNEYKVAYGLSITIFTFFLTLAHSTDQGQGGVQCECQYF